MRIEATTINQKNILSFINGIFHFVAKACLFSVLGFFFTFILIMLVYMGDLFVNTMTGNSKKPLFGVYVVMSGSMTPSIMVKDGIIVKRVDHDNYQVGDVITFSPVDSRYEGTTITHRIIEKESINSEESVYTTKGDHNIVKDSSGVKTESIYGKVLFKIPKIGYVQDFFLKPSNYFACLLGIALLAIIYYGGRILILLFKDKEAF